MPTPVWIARSEDEVPAGAAWLSPWEAARLDRMRYTKRRDEYLTSRLAAKHAMAAVLGVAPEPPSRFEVRHAPGGAPWPHVDDRPARLSLSMTDRAGWAVTVATADPAPRLGVDLELVEPRSGGFVRDWFTAAEQAGHAAATEPDLYANLVWSAKESALKVLRTGLRRDTRSVEVRLTDHAPTDGWQPLAVAPAEGGLLPGWWRRCGQFLVTVAADVALPPPADRDGAEARLAAAEPRHSWLTAPLVEGHATRPPDGP